MAAAIHGDLAARCSVDTARMQWMASPSGTVWRKRLHLVGAVESGQVTSVVRFDRNAGFAEHDHPAGEEILVLEGVFSDHTGDWPAGTFLLNPEGFRHAPFSQQGCLLFVKLRQCPGGDRKRVAADTNRMAWQAGAQPGIVCKTLYAQAGYTDRVELQRWEAGFACDGIPYPEGAEILVIDGGFEDENGVYAKGHWLRFPVGTQHQPRTTQGCSLYVKTGGLKYLRAATSCTA